MNNTQQVLLACSASGCASDGVTNVRALAREAWGERAESPDAGSRAFAYLWRRFGPPFGGSDDHKELCAYILTTAEPDMWLSLYPCGSRCGCGYLTARNPALRHHVRGSADAARLRDALLGTLRDMLLPVFVRDVAITIVGQASDEDMSAPCAERSVYAGYPVPKDAMDAMIRDDGMMETPDG